MIKTKEIFGSNFSGDFLELGMTSEKHFQHIPQRCVEPIFDGIWVSEIDLVLPVRKFLGNHFPH